MEPTEVLAATTIRRPPQEVYSFWRTLTNLPTFMAHLREITVTGATTSHWVAEGPGGTGVEWDAEVADDVPGEKITWHSVEGADVPNNGSVIFAPAPDGESTELHVILNFAVPGGKVGDLVARWFGEEPRQQLDDDLRRLKQVLETGEVMRSDGAPGGKQARGEFPQRPAQPLTEAEREEVLGA